MNTTVRLGTSLGLWSVNTVWEGVGETLQSVWGIATLFKSNGRGVYRNQTAADQSLAM